METRGKKIRGTYCRPRNRKEMEEVIFRIWNSGKQLENVIRCMDYLISFFSITCKADFLQFGKLVFALCM